MLPFETCEKARLARDARYDGRFFIAVTSTGIYCRPICPAPSPKSSNVRYFPTGAAAAEAGFRPCLRCRPEASPGTPPWLGTSVSVSRALRLISQSALDEGSVEELAARLGLGSRHLRRLFLKHLGATPVAVAQTRRIAFAKKLIDETRLPLTQIAMAAGFGSVRRFNTSFRTVYGRSPRELRSLRAKDQTPDAGHHVLRLDYRPPYHWNGLVSFLAMRAIPGVEIVDPNCYRRNFVLAEHPGQLEVRPVRGRNSLEVRICFPDPSCLFTIVERVRRLFDLSADPSAIAGHLSRDAGLKPIVRRHPGLRVPGCWDGFEIAVRAILGQQVSVKAATTLSGRLVERFGKGTFPAATELAAADIEQIGLPGRRAESVRRLAQAVAEGSLSLDPVAGLEEFEERITTIPGIGPWTAQYVAMRLGEPDAFPGGDLYLRPHAGRADAWRPWRAYAAMMLWKQAGDEAK